MLPRQTPSRTVGLFCTPPAAFLTRAMRSTLRSRRTLRLSLPTTSKVTHSPLSRRLHLMSETCSEEVTAPVSSLDGRTSPSPPCFTDAIQPTTVGSAIEGTDHHAK